MCPSAEPGRGGAGRSSDPSWRARDREWGVVADLLAATEAGQGSAVLVEGRSGMGKTHLLTRAADAAARRGFALARGSADEGRRLGPLAPLSGGADGSVHLPPAGDGRPSDPADLRFAMVERARARLEERA